MSAGYDGSINIDTKIESKNFNAGTKKLSGAISRSMGALTSKLASVAVGVSFVASSIIALGAGIIAFGLIAGKALVRFVNNLYESLSVTSAYRSKVEELRNAFDNLKGALYAAGATLLNALAPALMIIVEWLVKALNFLSMFIAALSGQKTVMQYVSGATQAAAGGAGKLAKNTKDAEKAAKGALAAFDQINVLQQETPETDSGGGGGGGGGSLEMIEVPIPEDFIKNTWKAIWDWVKLKTAEAWFWIWDNVLKPVRDFFINSWNTASQWFIDYVWTPIKNAAIEAWEIIKRFAISAWEFIVEKWNQLKTSFVNNVWTPIKNAAILAWELVKNAAISAWTGIKNVWNLASAWFKTTVIDPVKRYFADLWDNAVLGARNAWMWISTAFKNSAKWFSDTFLVPLQNGFKGALETILGFFTEKFDRIAQVVKGALNTVIGWINNMISGAVNGINGLVGKINGVRISWPALPFLGIGAGSLGFNIGRISAPQIPKLATGAVIPPNSEFLAVLGDQRSGKNIEAPESLIRQIFQEEMGSMANQEITINFAGTLGSLVREMKPYIDKEYQRIGKSLIKGSLA